ncbi:unnamed protein product [Linum trigynum]|uniref:Uncharacterized protein n=1 Tax=Linum trigynum TaxID=586398 RepID=A0AAV2EUT6_9ROSI
MEPGNSMRHDYSWELLSHRQKFLDEAVSPLALARLLVDSNGQLEVEATNTEDDYVHKEDPCQQPVVANPVEVPMIDEVVAYDLFDDD